MKRKDFILAVAFLIVCALLPVGWAVAIDWIQYDERAVGENSPLYEDVVNRPAKQIYALYTSEHNPDGTHKPLPYLSSADLNGYMLKSTYDADADNRADTAEVLTDGTNINSAAEVRAHMNNPAIHRSIDDLGTSSSALWSSLKISSALSANAAEHVTINDAATAAGSVWSSSKTETAINTAVAGVNVSEYALRGTGSTYLAYATFAPQGFFTSNNTFSIYGVVMVDTLDRAESFYRHVETEYSTNILNFGKTSDNKLQVTLGENTYTSGVVWTADTIGVPVEVGVICDKAGTAFWFMFNGETFASQTATYTFPSINGNEVHSIGDGLDGDVFVWHVTKGLLFAASTKHSPIYEGLSQCPYCLVSYDFDDGSGSALTDRYAQHKGGTARDLTVAGTWQSYPRGY